MKPNFTDWTCKVKTTALCLILLNISAIKNLLLHYQLISIMVLIGVNAQAVMAMTCGCSDEGVWEQRGWKTFPHCCVLLWIPAGFHVNRSSPLLSSHSAPAPWPHHCVQSEFGWRVCTWRAERVWKVRAPAFESDGDTGRVINGFAPFSLRRHCVSWILLFTAF